MLSTSVLPGNRHLRSSFLPAVFEFAASQNLRRAAGMSFFLAFFFLSQLVEICTSDVSSNCGLWCIVARWWTSISCWFFSRR